MDINEMKAIKEYYDANENSEKDILSELSALENKVVNTPFNPQNNDILDIYDIMDKIAGWQLELVKVLKKSVRYEMSAELLSKTYEKSNNESFAEYWNFSR